MSEQEPIHIISLGAGVQSSTMALMAAAGEITPMPKAAIFADTQAEPASVYRWLDWLEKQLPFPVHRVTAGSLTEHALSVKKNKKTGAEYYSNMIPAYTANADGSRGIVSRYCTFNHKIAPIEKEIRVIAGIKRGQKTVTVHQWIGISLDEVVRMKDSREPWKIHRWPLVEVGMRRGDCIRWMEIRGFPKPPRSACVYCPFHSNSEWRRLKLEEPEDFSLAVKFERDLQNVHKSISANGKPNGTPYLHNSCIPLDQVDFSTEEERGQLNMFNNECEGMCGV